jgi:NAD(P)-dependent dehydrogenase (short-subunit alcohol dehydrogenase family)
MGHIVITGASAGIGAAAAIELTRRGRRVLAVGRSAAKLAAVHGRMRTAAPSGLEVPAPIAVDLGSLEEVRRLAVTVADRCPRIDALVNNAGVQPARRRLSADGFELTFAVNHLAPFLLTHLLVDRLRASGGRVIMTSSSNHADGRLDFDDLQMEREWRAGDAYDRSKLANVLFTIELRARTGLPASSFHPGSITSHLNRESRWFRLEKIVEFFVYGRPSRGADTLVWLATSAEGGAPTAPYYVDRAPAPIAPLADDRALAVRLWEVSEQLVGLRTGRPAPGATA